jgi:serine protease AprX
VSEATWGRPPARHRWRRRTTAGILAGIIAAAAAGPASALPVDAGARHVRLVVMEAEGSGQAPERAVERLGGTVDARFGLIDGLAVTLPAEAVAELRSAPGIRSVAPDRAFKLSSDSATDGSVSADAGASMADVRTAIGASAEDNGGAGVDVALVDSGVTAVPGLAGSDVVVGPDFSDEAGDPELADRDGFGHGTHLAGIIAGRNPETGFAGIAPDARLVSVRVAAHDGSTTLSRLLAGLDWTVRNRNRDGLHIRVLNLAFGAEVTGSYRRDPLAAAVEAAWEKGIVVVTAAGNGGPESDSLDSPAYDPYVVAVGADDMLGTAEPADDVVAEFSSRGSAERSPDVIAPGVGVVSLRLADGFLDQQFPQARIGESGFRGSGTSQAAAVVSGAVARLLAARPELDPDQIKAILRSSARALAGIDARLQGQGLIDVATALGAAADGSTQRWQKAAPGPWRGRALGAEVAVEHPESSRWSSSRWSSSRWSSSRWSSSRWSSSRWSSSRWSSSRWSADTWGDPAP